MLEKLNTHIRPIEDGDVLRVLKNIRPGDWRELQASSGYEEKIDAADMFETLRLKVPGEYLTVTRGDEPVALIMVVQQSPVFGLAGFVAVEGWQDTAFTITRFLKRDFAARLKRSGYKRIEVRVLKEYQVSKKWIEYLGGHFDCDLEKFGVNGETFCLYSWIA